MLTFIQDSIGECMSSNPQIKALANEAAIKIKALTEAHQSQIEAIYQEYREQAAQIEERNAEELHRPSVTPAQSSKTKASTYDFTP